MVDLAETARTPSAQRAFDRRVFTDAERVRVESAVDVSRERWRHWAAKEAAFKALSKRRPRLVFSPASFVVQAMPRSSRRGRVVHAGERIPVRWTGGAGWVHCCAMAGRSHGRPAARVRGVDRPHAPTEASAAARTLARGLLRKVGARGCLALVRAGGRAGPLQVRGQGGLDLSLSHDGRFVSAAACARRRVARRLSDMPCSRIDSP